MPWPGVYTRTIDPLPAAWIPASMVTEIQGICGQSNALLHDYLLMAPAGLVALIELVTQHRSEYDDHNVDAEHPKYGGVQGLQLIWEDAYLIRVIAPAVVMDDHKTVVRDVNITGSINSLVDVGGVPNDLTWYGVHLGYNPESEESILRFSESFSAPMMPSGFTRHRLLGWVFTDDTTALHEIIPFAYNHKSGIYRFWPTTVGVQGHFQNILPGGGWDVTDLAAQVPPGTTTAMAACMNAAGFTLAAPQLAPVSATAYYNYKVSGGTPGFADITWDMLLPLDANRNCATNRNGTLLIEGFYFKP